MMTLLDSAISVVGGYFLSIWFITFYFFKCCHCCICGVFFKKSKIEKENPHQIFYKQQVKKKLMLQLPRGIEIKEAMHLI